MTYDSPFWAIEGKVIPEIPNFKNEGLVTQKDEKEKKKFWKFVGPWRELNSGHLGEMPECWPLNYPDIVIRRSRF